MGAPLISVDGFGRPMPMLRTLYTTVGSEEDAVRLARTLVDARLVACANFWPIRSVFRWEDKVQDEGEVAMVLKTTEAQVESARAKVEAVHPYDVPCVEVWPVDAAAAGFAKWVRDETVWEDEDASPQTADDVD